MALSTFGPCKTFFGENISTTTLSRCVSAVADPGNMVVVVGGGGGGGSLLNALNLIDLSNSQLVTNTCKVQMIRSSTRMLGKIVAFVSFNMFQGRAVLEAQ